MTREEWRKIWVTTLVKDGIFLETAENAFNVCYGKQDIDLTSDPEDAASAFVVSRTPSKRMAIKSGN